MSVAPWPVGLLFGLSLAAMITLAGPLLLFNPLFTSVLQARHEVPSAFDTSQAEVDRVTGEILGDLFVGGSFDAAFAGDPPLLNDRERSHMGDVSRLVQLLAGITLVALLVAVVTGLLLRHEPGRQGKVMVIAAGAIGAVALVLALVFAVAFDAAFLAFHQLFFPPGTYLFEPGSKLITLFPGGFWFDASLAAGGAIILTALAVAVIGLQRGRGAPQTPARP
jgi:integral membrane protein (TIGR01906 family)